MKSTLNLKLIIVIVVIGTVCSAVTTILLSRTEKKVVVVDAVKLFNGFKMKIEMEEKAAFPLKELNRRCDSIGNRINLMQSNSELIDEKLLYDYKAARAQWEQEYERSNSEINQQVWKRLNVLIADFGKERNYGVIIGANGMGSVLYNDNLFDVTDEAIKNVNLSYENKK